MSSSLSPILAAYFGGQKQQSDLITQARELSDSALRRQQAQEELKMRQSTIDEIAKQHGIENTRQQQQDELAHQIFLDTKNYHTNEATIKYIQALRESGKAPDQFHDHMTSLNVPGYTTNPTDGSLPIKTYGGTLQNINQPEVNPIQTVNIPGYGEQQVPAWKTEAQLNADKATALIPGQVDLYKKTIGDTNTQKLEQQMQRLQDTLSSREQTNAANNDLREKLADIRVGQAENAANHRTTQFMLSAGLPLDPDAAKKLISGYAMDEMTGKGTGNPRAAYGPIMGNMVTQAIENLGGRVLPSKVRDTIMGKANDVTQTLNTLQQLKDSVPVPNTMTGKVSNVLADRFGLSGLSPYKSIFDALQTSMVPKLDQVLGFTPGTLSRSPKLYEKLKSVTPLPGDDARLVQQKTANAADIFLSSISKDLSGYSADQRKALWQEIANDHPELINGNSGIRKKLFEAGNTGNYIPGEGYKLFGGQ